LKYTKSAPVKSIMSYNRFIAIAETAAPPNCPIPRYSTNNFLSFNVLSKVTAAYLVFLYDTQFLTISFKWLHVFIQ